MKKTRTYYIYFSQNITQVFLKSANDISLISFQIEGQVKTSLYNTLYFDFLKQDIALHPLLPSSTMNHQNVFAEDIVFAGYHYRIDETLEVLIHFLLTHGLTFEKGDHVAFIYGLDGTYLDAQMDVIRNTFTYMLRHEPVIIDGFYHELYLIQMGLSLLSYYTDKAWFYLQDDAVYYGRYIVPKAFYYYGTPYVKEELDALYTNLQKDMHYLSKIEIERIADHLHDDFDASTDGMEYLLKDEIFPIHHQIVDQVFTYQSKGLKKRIDQTLKEEDDITEVYAIYDFSSKRIQEDILQHLSRKRKQRFYLDDRHHLFDRYRVLVAEMVHWIHQTYRFRLLSIQSQIPDVFFKYQEGKYYINPHVLKYLPELEKHFLTSGEFRAYQSFAIKKS